MKVYTDISVIGGSFDEEFKVEQEFLTGTKQIKLSDFTTQSNAAWLLDD